MMHLPNVGDEGLQERAAALLACGATISPEGYLHQDLQHIQCFPKQPEITGVSVSTFLCSAAEPCEHSAYKIKQGARLQLASPLSNCCCSCALTLLVQVVCAPSVLVGNSAGALAALQAAVADPAMARGLMLLDCSLRYMRKLVEGMLERLRWCRLYCSALRKCHNDSVTTVGPDGLGCAILQHEAIVFSSLVAQGPVSCSVSSLNPAYFEHCSFFENICAGMTACCSTVLCHQLCHQLFLLLHQLFG